ncbi:unnamed protein product, partial [Gulo gulo]
DGGGSGRSARGWTAIPRARSAPRLRDFANRVCLACGRGRGVGGRTRTGDPSGASSLWLILLCSVTVQSLYGSRSEHMKHMKREDAQNEMLEEHCVLLETWGEKCAGDGEGLRRFVYCPGSCSTRVPAADAEPGLLEVSAGEGPAGAGGQGASSAR